MLKNIAIIAAGQGAPQGDENYCDNGIPFVKAGNLVELVEGKPITEIQKVSDEVAKKHKLRLYKKGSVLFAKSGMSCLKGYVYVLPQDAYVVSHLACVTPNEDISEYLRYYFQYNRPNKLIKDEAYPSIILADIEELKIDIKTKIERDSIVRNLASVAHLIGLQKKQLQEFDTLIKSRFVEMFGDISRNEYKYETKKLGDVANVGSSHRVFTNEFVEEGVPFYRGTEIGELAVGQIPINPYRISEEHYLRLASDETKPQIGDLLMPSICNKGQIWMVDTNKPFYYKDGRVLCISANREIYNTKYLQYYMRAKTEIEYPKLGSGSTFAEFKIFLLKDLDILTPPKAVQNQFATFVHQTDKLKLTAKEGLKKLEIMQKALMQQYFC